MHEQTIDPAALTGFICPKNRSTPLAATCGAHVAQLS
ncbi:hypothetical protein SAMN02745898_101867 [Streptomyces sp. 136MFCol5.1]|jgi:hypothetical protein|nr:hypothetical protein SAMN02745898_101867 [Streptomyces sp. 136MFCol5.1]